jgi:K+-sensing histidine kinase KdpD
MRDELRQKMGGLVISLKHDNVAQALVSFAKEYGITHVVLGWPKPRNFPWVGFSMHETLMCELPDVDLIIV